MSKTQWTARPEVGNEYWLRVILRIANVAGRGVARLCLYPTAAFFWLRTPASRADSASYLSRVLGQPAGARDTFKHYLIFATTILDRVFLLSGRHDKFDFEVIGEPYFRKQLETPSGIFLVGAHLGSLEALRSVGMRVTDRRVGMAMYESNAQRIGQFLRAIDPQLEKDIIGLGRADSMLRLAERLENGDMVGFLADRTFGDQSFQLVPFLGEDAPFPTGVFRMAAALRCPVLGMAALYMGGNRYQLHFEPLADFTDIAREDRGAAVNKAVDAYARLLERLCRIAPYNWFNFYDFWDQGDNPVATRRRSKRAPNSNNSAADVPSPSI